MTLKKFKPVLDFPNATRQWKLLAVLENDHVISPHRRLDRLNTSEVYNR